LGLSSAKSLYISLSGAGTPGLNKPLPWKFTIERLIAVAWPLTLKISRDGMSVNEFQSPFWRPPAV
jgi:hypothetical protein